MNSSVQKPTRVISMNIGKSEQDKMMKCTDRKEVMPLDFYSINNAGGSTKPVQQGAKGIGMVSEFLSFVKANASDEGNKPRGLISRDNIDFIILSLKNDVRVKYFKSTDSSIKIYFWTVEDAVSFYKQYFNLIEMNFTEEFDLGIGWESMCFKAEYLDDTHISQNQAIVNLQSFNDSQIEHRPKLEDDFFEMKPFSSKPGLNVSHNIELYSSQKSEFDDRVEYFNKMKPLFSKNDFKKMETSLEGGSLDFIFKNCKELAVGSISNVIVQKATKYMNDGEICLLVKSFGYDIAPISATKYGAYTIQTLILAAVTKASQNLISCYFEGCGRFLISHEIGNYSIQKILRFDQEMIYDFFMRDLDRIISDPLGFKVFRRCVPFFVNKRDIISEKLASIETQENSEQCRLIMDFLNE